jgi:hypothetical protein
LLPTMPPQGHHEMVWDGQMWPLTKNYVPELVKPGPNPTTSECTTMYNAIVVVPMKSRALLKVSKWNKQLCSKYTRLLVVICGKFLPS